MNILYFGDCWFTNVGESFIDIGAMELIKRIWPDSQVAYAGAMSDYYIRNIQLGVMEKVRKKVVGEKRWNLGIAKKVNACPCDRLYKADYIIVTGMVANRAFLNSYQSVLLKKYSQNGVKVIFWGMGEGFSYSKDEVEEFTQFLKEINPLLIMTRDEATYKDYSCFDQCIRGIDCAFWIKNSYFPKGFTNEKYDIVTYNRTKEPLDFKSKEWKNIIVRPYHFQYFFRRNCYKKNMFISDIPYDYLSLYANANNVYTDLVHATIISLQYGIPVKYSYTDDRSLAISAINDLEENIEGFMSIDPHKLENQKDGIVELMKTIIYKNI